MKQETTNVFNKGLLMDLNPLTTPNNVVTNCLNGTFITFNGNDVILQNDMGNGKVESAKLPAGYIPLGVKEYGGIIYVVSYNPFTKKGQVGSFPSPKQDFTSDDHNNDQQNIISSEFFDTELKTTLVKKYLNNEEIIKVGDLFEICLLDNTLETTGINNILTILSDLQDLNATTGINEGRKILNIKVATIDSNNNISYLDLDNDVDYIDTSNTNSLLARFLMPINKEVTTLDDFQAYTYSRNCKLLIIAELETLDSLTLNITADSETEFIYKFEANIQPYDFWRWLEIKITYSENEEVSQTFTKYIKNIYKEDFPNNSYEDNLDVKPGITDPLYPSLTSTGKEDDISYYNTYMTSDSNITWTLKADNKNTMIDYEIIPHMTYGPVNLLKKTGRLNVKRYGDNYVELTKWKYKTKDDVLTIDWGIDYNSTTVQRLYRIDFKFIEVKNNNPSTWTMNAGGVDEDNNPIYSAYLSQDYTSTINLGLSTLQKNKLYLCNINYYKIDVSNIDENPLTEYSNWGTPWVSENRFVYTNDLMDQYYYQYIDFNNINPSNKLHIWPQTIRRHEWTDESFDNKTLISYNSSGTFTSNAVKTTTMAIDINSEAITQHDIDFNINWNSVNLEIVPVVSPSITNKVTNGHTFDDITSWERHTTIRPITASLIIPLRQYNGSTTYTEKATNPNVLLDVWEDICLTNIDDNSIFDNSRRFQFSLIEKNLFTSGKKLVTINSTTKAYVLDKYYTNENYSSIFGYIVPIESGNTYPRPNKAYTYSQAHFMSKGTIFDDADYLPNKTLSLKTYVEFSNSQLNPNTFNKTGNFIRRWLDWGDIINDLTIDHLPSVSIYTSKALSQNSHTIETSPDYLIKLINNSYQFVGNNWCYPLLKVSNTDSTNNSPYAFIHIGQTNGNPITLEKAGLNFKDMFDDKYLFQPKTLSNTNLYVPDPSNWTYSTYTVNNTINIKTGGSVESVDYTINGTLITTSSVTDCLSYFSLGTVNYNNVNIITNCIFESKNITISVNSCDFSRLTNTDWTQNVGWDMLLHQDWPTNSVDTLFKNVNGDLIDITDEKDEDGNLFYNKDKYYIYSQENYKVGNGLWVISDEVANFRELLLKMPTTLTKVSDSYPYSVGKFVTDYDGQDRYTMIESISGSRTGGGRYSYLNDSPYNFNIYYKPINWD